MVPYKHIFIEGTASSEKYKPLSKPRSEAKIPARNRATHSQQLLQKFSEIWREKEQLLQQRNAEKIATREGTYIQFIGLTNHDLITKSLEDLRIGVRLLNVRDVSIGEDQTQTMATVYVPNGKEGHFISKIEAYKEKDRKSGRPWNANLVESIEDVRIALLEALWTDKPETIPTDTTKWCEAWLNVNTKENKEKAEIEEFIETLLNIGIEYKTNSIIFPERAVILINVNRNHLIELMKQSDLLAEFRAGQEPAGFWTNENRIEQQEWIDNLLERVVIKEGNVKVCILDAGVNSGHQLLQPLIDDANTLTVKSDWRTHDHRCGAGHGTLMAGIAGYGQLENILTIRNQVFLTHKLCSVKILPNQGETERELWGDITSQGISRAELQNPNMVLIYCMAVTSSDDTDRGRPSSWSGAIDNLAFGEGDNQRLIIISGGNVADENAWTQYPNANYVASVQNPAQAWNALVAGAYTAKVQVNDERFENYATIAKEGELSPYSSTSRLWELNKWPIKPDVVFEGGNLLKGSDDSIRSHKDLELLSLSKMFTYGTHFDTICATSAAAAQASWFAAKIAHEYPEAWAETVRGLMVHSAEWHPAMLAQLSIEAGKSNRGDYRSLLRTFGYGVPDLERALHSKESALTYIAQETIQPYRFKEGTTQPETNEMHFFNLPWARDLLLDMGSTPVTMKITLSYFIEPGAGEIGWKDKYRYQSHGLRFDVNNIDETEEVFRKRINVAAREKDEKFKSDSGSERWVLGTSNRVNGSIHSDFWEGSAAELATCNLIAVYPVIGWWRERHQLGKVENQARYSLIISLETPVQDVELYTTVKNIIDVPIEIST